MDEHRGAVEGSERAAQALMSGLEQIQEILVEPRVQRIEESIEALDRRRAKEIADLHRDLDRSLGRLDAFVKKEVEELSERHATERRERSAALNDLGKQIHEEVERVERRLAKLEDAAASSARELREQMLDQFREFIDTVHRWKEEVSAAVEGDFTAPHTEGAERASAETH